MAVPKLFKETNVFKKNAIVNGITDAAKRATSYVTDLTNGIFVHPENDDQNGVRITSLIEIIKSGIAALQIDSTSLQINTLVENVLTETARFAGNGLYLAGQRISLGLQQGIGRLMVHGTNGSSVGLNIKAVAYDSSGNERKQANFDLGVDSAGEAGASLDCKLYVAENLTVADTIDTMNIQAYDITNDNTLSVDIKASGTYIDKNDDAIGQWSDLVSFLPGLLKRGTITDFDGETETGFYTYSSSATNRPPVSAGGACLVLHISTSSTWQLAFITSTSSTAMHAYARRLYSSTSWTAWRAFTFAS